MLGVAAHHPGRSRHDRDSSQSVHCEKRSNHGQRPGHACPALEGIVMFDQVLNELVMIALMLVLVLMIIAAVLMITGRRKQNH